MPIDKVTHRSMSGVLPALASALDELADYAFLRRLRLGAAEADRDAVAVFGLPSTGSRRFAWRRSPAALRFGFAAPPVSCARLRFNAVMRSMTGDGVEVGLAFTGNP